jgi:GntR family transcriptional repressor for pyruvate dehydrogenase complex
MPGPFLVVTTPLWSYILTNPEDEMPFQKIDADKLSQSVVRQIERLILQGVLRPGERLPAERELSERMGVSRPSLREAVAELEAAGLLASRAGSGIYVAEVLGSAFSPALIRLFASHEEAVNDYVSFRRDLEGLAAERAARLGSETDLKVINSIYEKMEAAHAKRDPTDEARLDAEFHMAIMEASHNVILLHMMRSMFELLREGVFYNRQAIFRQRQTRGALLAQHQRINDALLARDPEAARAASEAHMDFIRTSLADQRRADKNESVAQLRLAQEAERG